MLERAVVGAFGIGRKNTGGKLAHSGMIAKAFAAITFAGAGFVSAVAPGEVLFFDTVHPCLLGNGVTALGPAGTLWA